MPKIEVVLNDKEFEILNSLEKIEGKDVGEKLGSIYSLIYLIKICQFH